VEQLFSSSGSIVTKQQSSLYLENVDILFYLRDSVKNKLLISSCCKSC